MGFTLLYRDKIGRREMSQGEEKIFLPGQKSTPPSRTGYAWEPQAGRRGGRSYITTISPWNIVITHLRSTWRRRRTSSPMRTLVPG